MHPLFFPYGSTLLPDELKLLQNREYLIDCIGTQPEGGLLLQHTTSTLCDDEKVMEYAIYNNANSIQFGSERLKSNRKLALIAVSLFGPSIQWFNEEITSDEEICCIAIKDDGMSIRFVHETMCDNESMVEMAVRSNGHAMQYASERLKNNKKFILSVVAYSVFVLKYISAALKGDPDVVKRAVEANGGAIMYADLDCKYDRTLVSIAVEQWGGAIQFTGFTRDREMLILASKNVDSIVTSLLRPIAGKSRFLKVMLEANRHRDAEFWEYELRAFNEIYPSRDKHVRSRRLFEKKLRDIRLDIFFEHVNQYRIAIILIKRIQRNFKKKYWCPVKGKGYIALSSTTLYRVRRDNKRRLMPFSSDKNMKKIKTTVE